MKENKLEKYFRELDDFTLKKADREARDVLAGKQKSIYYLSIIETEISQKLNIKDYIGIYDIIQLTIEECARRGFIF